MPHLAYWTSVFNNAGYRTSGAMTSIIERDGSLICLLLFVRTRI